MVQKKKIHNVNKLFLIFLL